VVFFGSNSEVVKKPHEFTFVPMQGVMLQIKNLTIRLPRQGGEVAVVRDISLDIMPGQVLALVGESGSGKTVTSLAVMGLLPLPLGQIASGQILFEGKNLINLTPEEHRLLRGKRMAMVFQEPMTSLNPLMRCGRQVAESLRHHMGLSAAQARAETMEWFGKVKLPNPERIYDAYPHQLSGGQKQRVMIAMALACRPSLLIADEPTTALDVTVQAEILHLLRDLQREYAFSILFITHDLAVARAFAHHTAVMYQGQVVETGPSDQVLSRPTHPYTRGLVACLPKAGTRWERLPELSDFLEEDKEFAPMPAGPIPAITHTLIRVEDVSVTYGQKRWPGKSIEVHALRGVSLEIKKGETLGLVGESGSGKSTLGRAILGLTPIAQGSITYEDRAISGLSAGQMKPWRSIMQLVFQDPYSSLNPRMTVGTAIAEAVRTGNARDQAIDLLEKVGLGAEHYGRYPHQFSGGQRQRIVIARALATRPRFLVCDESVAALDVSVRARVLNLLNDLKAEFDLTLLFISHDLGVIYQMCDRIAVLHHGELKEIGPAREVFFHPADPYTRKLIDAIAD